MDQIRFSISPDQAHSIIIVSYLALLKLMCLEFETFYEK